MYEELLTAVQITDAQNRTKKICKNAIKARRTKLKSYHALF